MGPKRTAETLSRAANCVKLCKVEATSAEEEEMIIVECPSLHDQTDTACDVCVRKDIHDQLATTYCTSCSTKFCLKHLQSHDDCFWDHVKIDMEEYKQQAKKLEPRPCSEHPDLEYSMGCGVCQVVICNKCVSNLGLCTDGAPHRLRSLEDLVPELYQEISELKTLIVNKEDVLSTVFKETAKTISDFEMETKMMVELLRKTCNNQINSIRQKYDNLEKDLMKFRNKIQKEMEHFMKNNVDRKLGILSDCKRKVEFDFQNSHKVDIVHGYSQAFKDMNDLLKGDPPALPSYNVVVLVKKETPRDIDLKMEFHSNDFPDMQIAPCPADHRTRCLTLLNEIPVSSKCNSISYHHSSAYVSLENNSVERINLDSWQCKVAQTTHNRVNDAAVFNRKIYLLERNLKNFIVRVYLLTGRSVVSWDHLDGSNKFNKLTFVDNMIVIPDRATKHLVVYTLKGDVVKNIPCDLLSEDCVTLCAADSDSVVVSDHQSSQIFKLSISTEKVVWTTKCVKNPQGITCNSSHVFATNRSTRTRIWILDSGNGELLAEISDPIERPVSNVFDLCLEKKTLIVSRHNEKKVLFYQLNWVM